MTESAKAGRKKLVKVKSPIRLDVLFTIIIECKKLKIPMRLAIHKDNLEKLPQKYQNFMEPL